MLLPQIILAIGSILAGFIPFGNFISSDGFVLKSHIDWNFSILPIFLSSIGIISAGFFFYKKSDRAENISLQLGTLYSSIKNKLYIDEVYVFVTKKIIIRFIAKPAAWIDRNLIDGSINTIGKATQVFSLTTSIWQSGRVQAYSIWFLAGTLGLLLMSLYFLQII